MVPVGTVSVKSSPFLTSLSVTLPLVAASAKAAGPRVGEAARPGTFHVMVVVPRPLLLHTLVGLALAANDRGPATVTVVDLVVEIPFASVAVSVYAVVADGCASRLPAVVGMTEPMPLSIERLVAPVVL